MRLIFDMDDVLVELLDEWLIHLNTYNVLSKTKEDITSWNMKVAYPDLTDKQLYGCLNDVQLWERVQPVKDAYKYLKLLKEEGHEIYVATASYPNSYFIKTQYCLFRHFDFLNPTNVICIHNKSLLDGDVLFDDYHENLREFKGVKVLKNAPYNKNCDEECFHFRVNTWEEFYNIVKEISKLKEESYE